MMAWFKNFTENIHLSDKKGKLKKAHVFRRFVRMILEDFQPVFGELQKYI
jgi:hypothetical protein